MGPSPSNWLAAHRADLTLGKTAICMFVAMFYGRIIRLSTAARFFARVVAKDAKSLWITITLQ